MSKFYITFGFIHKDSKGNSLRNCYTIVEAENEAEARQKCLIRLLDISGQHSIGLLKKQVLLTIS